MTFYIRTYTEIFQNASRSVTFVSDIHSNNCTYEYVSQTIIIAKYTLSGWSGHMIYSVIMTVWWYLLCALHGYLLKKSINVHEILIWVWMIILREKKDYSGAKQRSIIQCTVVIDTFLTAERGDWPIRTKYDRDVCHKHKYKSLSRSLYSPAGNEWH